MLLLIGMALEETYEKIRSFLNMMGLKFFFDEEDKVFVVPFEIEDKVFPVLVIPQQKWILTVAKIANVKKDLPDVNKENLYRKLLRETFYLNEVTYGLTDDEDVVVHAEESVSSLSFENFQTEFFSVVAGLKHWLDSIKPGLS